MTHDDLDTAVLAKLSSGMHLTSMTNESRKKEQKEQNMQRTDFYHHSFRICHDLFTLLHGISQDKLIALVMHYKVAGVEARVQRNKCKPTACVMCEAFPKQVNFLLDESIHTGKRANTIVSMLHYFDHCGVGECDVHLHADNCSGQNQNSCMMQYLMWRVLTGHHKNITLSFLLTGHTKFSCDWCFGQVILSRSWSSRPM